MVEACFKLEGIEHVQLAMPAGGEPAARHFYDTILGIAEVAKPPHLASRGGCWFEQGALKIHLGVAHDFIPAKKAHIAFAVTGLNALVDCVECAGFIVAPDCEALSGFRRRYVADPFGNRLELMERI